MSAFKPSWYAVVVDKVIEVSTRENSPLIKLPITTFDASNIGEVKTSHNTTQSQNITRIS
jgi:hypothetical protein